MHCTARHRSTIWYVELQSNTGSRQQCLLVQAQDRRSPGHQASIVAELRDLVPGDGRPVVVEDAASASRVRVPVLRAQVQMARVKKKLGRRSHLQTVCNAA